MCDQKAPDLVLGEAPESDDEHDECSGALSTQLSKSYVDLAPAKVAGSAIAGEAVEFDEEVDVYNIRYNSSASSNADTSKRAEKEFPIKDRIQSVTLKKLREKNIMLYDSLRSFKTQILTSSNYELSNINQQLLKSQMDLQQTLNIMRQVKTYTTEYLKKLNDIAVAEYIPVINIKVPARII